MKPALTAEEWGIPEDPPQSGQRLLWFDKPTSLVRLRGNEIAVNWDGAVYDTEPAVLSDRARHAVAALALYGQSFGFTREDVIALRQLGWPAQESIADRIEALLPPEG